MSRRGANKCSNVGMENEFPNRCLAYCSSLKEIFVEASRKTDGVHRVLVETVVQFRADLPRRRQGQQKQASETNKTNSITNTTYRTQLYTPCLSSLAGTVQGKRQEIPFAWESCTSHQKSGDTSCPYYPSRILPHLDRHASQRRPIGSLQRAVSLNDTLNGP